MSAPPSNDRNLEDPEYTAVRHPSASSGVVPRDTQQNITESTNMSKNVCYGDKCRILQAVGITRRLMFCAPGKQLCSGCNNELMRHRKVKQMENALMMDFSSNNTLFYIQCYAATSIPMSLQNFHRLFYYLPVFNITKRDDHIYGASRYLANTLGIPISGQNLSKYIDPPPSDNDRRSIWRIASFKCRCQHDSIPHQYGYQSFCKQCYHLIYIINVPHPTTCPACGKNDSWEILGKPCLACLVAAIIYRNQFHNRFQQHLEMCLSSYDSYSDPFIPTERQPKPRATQNNLDEGQFYAQRRKVIENNFRDIKAKAPIDHARAVFAHLASIQKSLTVPHTCRKWTQDSLHYKSRDDKQTYNIEENHHQNEPDYYNQ
jgi:hypothetical protein